MPLSQYIRDNTDDGRNIAGLLIDVMEGRLDGTKISHRLTAARLLTIYGYEDAPDFIADNTPGTSETESGEKLWPEIDPGLRALIKARTDDGRVICMFLIDVMEGRIEGIHVGHRVNAAKELLDRAFGRSRSSDLPKPPGSKTPRRRTRKTHQRVAPAQTQPVPAAPTASAAVITEHEHLPEPEADGDFDADVYRAASRCTDPNFDPMLAASDDEYHTNYDGCENISCPYHGDPEDPDFDPNAHHY